MKEFDFIREIKKQFPNDWENSIGNDCGVFSIQGKGLITKDLLVEGTHFFPDIPLKALAHKSLAVNMSDIYADGGKPLFFVIGVGASQKDSERIKELYQYFYNFCASWNVPIIGGDTVASAVLFLSVTCVGSTENPPWLRKNAKTGDWIYVTGTLGSSAYGFSKIKNKGHDLSDPDIYRHLFPPVRQNTPMALKNTINAGADISDGFLQDLSRILEESGKGARIDLTRVPFSQTLPESQKEEFGLYGGEDYELILTTDRKIDTKKFEEQTQIPLSCIGKITDQKGVIGLTDALGKEKYLKIKDIEGYNHWQ